MRGQRQGMAAMLDSQEVGGASAWGSWAVLSLHYAACGPGQP